MRKRIEKRILVIVALFYIFVTLLAVGILSFSGAVRDKQVELSKAIDETMGNRVEAIEKLQSEMDEQKLSKDKAASEEASTEEAAEASANGI